MDETQIAQAIRDGELASPQKFANSWYFALRITGTGAAYRQQLKEYVWRDSSLYLNDHFLARCNGLPVIVEHPPGLMLNSEEYADRNIGSVVLPFIPDGAFLEANSKAKPEEVWGVARILDERAARYMRDHVSSTSPAVVFKDPDDNDTVTMEDGKHLLIEGKPTLLDHLAICELGTWDKQGPPSGVDVSNGEGGMAEEDKKEEKMEEDARDDANSSDTKLDKILAHLDSAHKKMDAHGKRMDDLSKRMDAYDSKKDDTEEEAELEERQASELKKLAEEEEHEAEEAREDKRADDASHHLHRRDDESMAAHSKRVDAFARKHRLDSIMCRDDESARDHSCRVDEMSPEDFEGMGAPKAVETSNDDDRKRDDRRARDDDRKRDDRRARDDDNEDDDDSMSRDDRKRDDDDDDRKRADSILKRDMDTIKSAVAALARKVKDPSDELRSAFADAQARADSVFAQFGQQAPPPLQGERLLPYQIRMARKLQQHSKIWAKTDLAAVAKADRGAFENALTMIYADAVQAARSPTDLPPMTLREVVKRRPGGGEESTFVGDAIACWLPFMAPGRAAKRLSFQKRI
jgi:hypothetical protein